MSPAAFALSIAAGDWPLNGDGECDEEVEGVPRSRLPCRVWGFLDICEAGRDGDGVVWDVLDSLRCPRTGRAFCGGELNGWPGKEPGSVGAGGDALPEFWGRSALADASVRRRPASSSRSLRIRSLAIWMVKR